ncbi:DNA replication/repair protein RecF, partial [Fulvivirga sp. RKSG066]|uniref:DNA replication/repair protein RecF n=1 Tax=Fulvivirga aurantia TaxID=2529383 RepID=UPI0012BBE27F
MHIEKLSLINFKNYEEVTLNFSENVNCILGKNGSGKTNLLDAIYYLSTTKSALNTIDNQNIRFGEAFFTIRSLFIKSGDEYKVDCILKEGAKKIIKVNSVEYDKLREHVGKFPVVFISPNDTDLIREGSEIRRKFFDQIISQTDRDYLDKLIEYNHFLKQR